MTIQQGIMKTIAINIYTLDELKPEARDYALKRFIDINVHHDWCETGYLDFIAISGTIGLRVDYDSIECVGFFTQDSGSAFSAEVDLIALIDGIITERWKSYAPELRLQLSPPDVDRRVMRLLRNGNITPFVKLIRTSRRLDVRAQILAKLAADNKSCERLAAELDRLEDWLQGVADCLNRCLFKSMEREYEFQTGEPAVAETITANDYHFTIDGSYAGNIEQFINDLDTTNDN